MGSVMLVFVTGDQLPMHMAVALSYEVDAAANLLRRSLLLVREFRIASLDADPLFACLAIGMEKVTKLTIGLAAVEEHGTWPNLGTMRGRYGHNVLDLDEACRDYISRNAHRAAAPPYIRQLMAKVGQDQRISLILNVMKRYGEFGRFYNLDALADTPQAEPPPRKLWDRVEQTVWEEDPAVRSKLGGPDFAEAREQINRQIAGSVEAWWELYFRAWVHGVVGPHARQWSGQLSPSGTVG